LRQLCIRDWWSTDPEKCADIVNLLRCLPSITHLTLRGIQNAAFLRTLPRSLSDLPRLEVLELPELDPDTPFDDILVFLEARRPMQWHDDIPLSCRPDTLKKVIVTYQKAWCFKPNSWRRDYHNFYLNAYRRFGMTISIGPNEFHEA
jgi:hypothetical protein